MKRLAVFLAAPLLLAFTTPTVVTWSAPSVRANDARTRQAVIRVSGNIVNRWHVYSMSQKPRRPQAARTSKLERERILARHGEGAEAAGRLRRRVQDSDGDVLG